jgi:hypothetical protein
MNMKHVLGMAKSFLDFNGSKSQKLELDYLRLVYAVKDLKSGGDDAQGYLVVLDPRISERVKRWENKYRGKGLVKIIDIPLPDLVKNHLKQEKINNLAGMVAGVTGGVAGKRSSASFGQDAGETNLKKMIFRLEPGVKEVKDENKFPCYVRWDFYGVVDQR